MERTYTYLTFEETEVHHDLSSLLSLMPGCMLDTVPCLSGALAARIPDKVPVSAVGLCSVYFVLVAVCSAAEVFCADLEGSCSICSALVGTCSTVGVFSPALVVFCSAVGIFGLVYPAVVVLSYSCSAGSALAPCSAGRPSRNEGQISVAWHSRHVLPGEVEPGSVRYGQPSCGRWSSPVGRKFRIF
ncbi:hypothetical protein ROHU_018771 [Labeo rohita]|uniref:Uncharacterized protein n=1 Tax=Labeo rohita TaxID=84645 RepID=A0A498NAZ3_LABRO|nr:hypothetical protein ROHU_018771 [Labeo rohita]